MAIRKSVITLEFSGFTFGGDLISAPPTHGISGAKSTISAFNDYEATNFVATPATLEDISLVILDEGGTVFPPDPGTLAEVTIKTGYSDGGAAVEAESTFFAYVQDVEPTIVEVAGNRRSAWTIVVTPQGGDVEIGS